jgi:hypothetical protein
MAPGMDADADVATPALRVVAAFGGEARACEAYAKALVKPTHAAMQEARWAGGSLGVVFLAMFGTCAHSPLNCTMRCAHSALPCALQTALRCGTAARCCSPASTRAGR